MKPVNDITDEGGLSLSEAITKNTTLQSLNLWGKLNESVPVSAMSNQRLAQGQIGNNFYMDGERALSEALKANTSLTFFTP